MKKLLISLVSAFCIIFVSSCSKSPADKIADILNDASEKIEKSDNFEDQMKYGTEAYSRIQEITKDMPMKEQMEVLKDEKVKEATNRFTKAGKKMMQNSLLKGGEALKNLGGEIDIEAESEKIKDQIDKASEKVKEILN